jgi:hypothetical protein
LKEDVEGEEQGNITSSSPPPLYIPPRNRGVYFGHGIPVGEINATVVFSSLGSVALAKEALRLRDLKPGTPGGW